MIIPLIRWLPRIAIAIAVVAVLAPVKNPRKTTEAFEPPSAPFELRNLRILARKRSLAVTVASGEGVARKYRLV